MKILWFMKKQLDVALDRTVRLATIDALQRQGHEVTFVTGFRDAPVDYGLGSSLRYIESSRIPFVNHVAFVGKLQRELPALVAELKPDVIVLDAFTVGAGIRWLAGLGDAPRPRPRVIADVRTVPVGSHGWKKRVVDGYFGRAIRRMNRLDGVTAITPAMLDVLRAEYGLRADLPAGIWTSGVDIDRFDPAAVDTAERDAIRAGAGGPDAFVAIYHGVIIRDRGIGDLIEAVRIAQPADGRHVHLLLVGEGADREALLREAEASGAASHVTYVPSVPNDRIPAYVAAADVGVLPFPDHPGWRVSSPIKLFEYLAMGKPVIPTDIVAHRAVAGGTSAATFAASNAPADLAAALEMVAALAPEELSAVAVEARDLAARHTWDSQVTRLVEFVRTLGVDDRSVHAGPRDEGRP